MNKFSIYIHVPWCRRRCPYCDFYLEVGKPNNNFLNSIIVEWECRHRFWYFDLAQSLYFGGGTPSLLNPKDIDGLLSYFIDKKYLSHEAEITLEVNPEDIHKAYVKTLINTAVNRISVGIQSLDDKILQKLGRKHTARSAKDALETLIGYGFKNISVDLIISVPNEVPEKIIESLFYLNELSIPHISTYLLTIEDKTKFSEWIKLGKMKAPDEDQSVDIYKLVQKCLISLGYIQYDISSYAKPGFFSAHNQIYWGSGSYMGLGPGAHSMRYLLGGGIERLHNHASINQWLKNPVAEINFIVDRLGPKKALLESLAFGLRNMVTGIHPYEFSKRHQKDLPKNFFALIKKFKDCGWLEEKNGLIKISCEGALFADHIMRDILCC
jgi:oxygen-independent coproporphyrinogen III oxidase